MRLKRFFYTIWKRVTIILKFLCGSVDPLRHELYKSINTLPIFNWMEISTSGDVRLLIKRKRFLPGKYLEAWDQIYDEYYVRFGKTKELTAHLMEMREAIILRAELAEKMHPVKNIRLKELERKIEGFGKGVQVSDFAKSNQALSKFMGVRLDPHTTTVAEWYGARALMEDAAAHIKKENEARKAK